MADSGLPEGCSLSVVAMTLIDWIWDKHQAVFAPSSIPQSYVDNLSLIAQGTGSILGGF